MYGHHIIMLWESLFKIRLISQDTYTKWRANKPVLFIVSTCKEDWPTSGNLDISIYKLANNVTDSFIQMFLISTTSYLQRWAWVTRKQVDWTQPGGISVKIVKIRGKSAGNSSRSPLGVSLNANAFESWRWVEKKKFSHASKAVSIWLQFTHARRWGMLRNLFTDSHFQPLHKVDSHPFWF